MRNQTMRWVNFIAMVQTRNQAKKITFDDDYFDNAPEEVEEHEVIEISEEESDDDEAPEEESASKAKEDIIAREQAIKDAELDRKRKEKERRKQQTLRNQQQKEQKKQKEQELPELLPDDILEAAKELAEEPEVIKPKHKTNEDFELELKKQAKIEKLKKLKQLNKSSVKKGPVHVAVLSNTSKKNYVPKAEAKVLGSREKWLKRKSLHKK